LTRGGCILAPQWVALALASVLWAACGDEGPGEAGPLVPRGRPAPGEDGAACTSGSDCFGGSCLTELEAGLPSGYCTSFQCGPGDCHGGVCFEVEGQSACLDECHDGNDCRPGYACLDFGTHRFCDFDGVPQNEVGESPGGVCQYGCEPGSFVRIDCGYTPSRQLQGRVFQYGLPYALSVGVHGFVLAVWTDQDDEAINLVSIRNSAGSLLALKGGDAALNVNSFRPDNELAATSVPFAPRVASFLEGASGLVQVQSRGQRLCRLLAQGLQGHELTLHVYLVGTGSALRTDTLHIDPDFVRLRVELERLLGLAEIRLAAVQGHDVDELSRQAYRILREPADLRAALALTRDPSELEGGRPIDALSINLLLVDDIQYADGTDTVGQAGNLPGPPGLHGTAYSGIVAETASFRADPEYLALTIAHELGHFLGLRHTTEPFLDDFAFGRTDPLSDTRECPDVRALMEGCPDYRNLMFPFAPPSRDASRLELSPEQGWVLRRNPLVR
jgi:hypothetical protein